LAPGYLEQYGILDPRDLAARQERLAMEQREHGTFRPQLLAPWDVPLEANAMMAAPIPILGDVLGLAADAKMYATDPESRTLANFALTGAGALPFVPSAAMFAGLLAKTADMDALAKAKLARAGGADPRDVWREHGWFEGPDGQWRFEIDDSGAALTGRNAGALPSVIDHSPAVDAYPDLGEVGATTYPGQDVTPFGYKGVYTEADTVFPDFPETDKIDAAGRTPQSIRSTLLHEMQHAVQNREGFAPGGRMDAGGFEAYRRLAGEAEARAVQTRMDMTPEQRRATYPLDSYDVPLDELIVRRDGGGPQMSQPLAPQAADALDMSTEARMARAREQGFEYRRNTRGETPFNDTDYAMFVKADPADEDIVSSYGDNEWTARAQDAVPVEDIQKDIVRAIAREAPELRDQYQTTAAQLAREANPEDIVNSAGLWDDPELAQFVYENVLGPRGIESVKTRDGLLVFGPEAANVRSTKAAFDPAKRDSSNLLASALAAGLLAPGAARYFVEDDEQ
jgi:hypothetical protein